MPVMWSCPDPNCPPTGIAPKDLPEFGDEAGAESEARFTTDEVAILLNVPLDTIRLRDASAASGPSRIGTLIHRSPERAFPRGYAAPGGMLPVRLRQLRI